jgi:hypothetical protein
MIKSPMLMLTLASWLGCASQVGAPELMHDGGANDAGVGRDSGTPPDVGQCVDDAHEGDDSADHAQAFEGEGFTAERINCPGDEDWFRIDVLAGSDLRVELHSEGEVMPLLAAFAGRNREAFGEIESEPGRRVLNHTETRWSFPLFLRVRGGASQGSPYTLQLRSVPTACPTDYLEPNNNLDAARPLPTGTLSELTACDLDYYWVNAAFGVPQSLLLSSEGGVVMELMDNAGHQVLRSVEVDADGHANLPLTSDDERAFLVRVRATGAIDAPRYSLHWRGFGSGNDNCAEAEDLRLRVGGDPVTVRGSTELAATNTAHGSCGNPRGYRSSPGSLAPERVYRIDIPAPGARLRADVQAEGGDEPSFDSVLYLRNDCGSDSQEVACNDDREAEGRQRLNALLDTELSPGTYFLHVDGYHLSAGAYELTVALEAIEVNDCSDAEALGTPEDDSFYARIDLEGDNLTSNFAPRTCAGRRDDGAEQVFTFELEIPRSFAATTGRIPGRDGYDTVLYLLRGCGGIDELECHDDIGGTNKLSHIEVDRLEPGLYTLVVDAFNADQSGSVSLEVNFGEPAP